jgi:hypothetical protein
MYNLFQAITIYSRYRETICGPIFVGLVIDEAMQITVYLEKCTRVVFQMLFMKKATAAAGPERQAAEEGMADKDAADDVGTVLAGSRSRGTADTRWAADSPRRGCTRAAWACKRDTAAVGTARRRTDWPGMATPPTWRAAQSRPLKPPGLRRRGFGLAAAGAREGRSSWAAGQGAAAAWDSAPPRLCSGCGEWAESARSPCSGWPCRKSSPSSTPPSPSCGRSRSRTPEGTHFVHVILHTCTLRCHHDVRPNTLFKKDSKL